MRAILLLIAFIVANAVCAENLNVAFIIDGSDTVLNGPATGDPWDSVLHFFREVADGWTIGPNDTKVALGTFGNEANLIFDLNRYPVKSALLDAISNVSFPGGELHKQGLVNQVITKIFADSAGNTSDARNIEVMFTDGTPFLNKTAVSASSTARQATGVRVFVICMTTGCDETFASGLASPPKQQGKTYFLVNDYDSLNDILVNDLWDQISTV